jgi:hypothetical protein
MPNIGPTSETAGCLSSRNTVDGGTFMPRTILRLSGSAAAARMRWSATSPNRSPFVRHGFSPHGGRQAETGRHYGGGRGHCLLGVLRRNRCGEWNSIAMVIATITTSLDEVCSLGVLFMYAHPHDKFGTKPNRTVLAGPAARKAALLLARLHADPDSAFPPTR